MFAALPRLGSHVDPRAILLGLAICLFVGSAFAASPIAVVAEREPDGAIRLTWTVAPGVYLYRDKLKAKIDGKAVSLATAPGDVKDDPTFGPTEIYHSTATARIAPGDAPEVGVLEVGHQGCAEAGTCYPPTKTDIDLATLVSSASPVPSVASDATWESRVASAEASAPNGSGSSNTSGPDLGGSLPLVLAAFFGIGVLLSLTPCVYPMVPILAGILARSAGTSRHAGLVTSLSYVLAMASAYAVLGLAAAWSGQNLQAALQTPIATGATALLFGVLALSMMGAFDLQLPAGLAQRMFGVYPGVGGRILGPAALGFVAALIVGPCATPPLAAALLYVTQTGDVARGSAALFALGLGMGVPLLAFGAFGARILPKSGPWMVRVKEIFGAVFLAVAISMGARALPGQAALLLWGAAAITVGVFAGAWESLAPQAAATPRLFKAAGLVLTVWGGALVVGAAAGGDDPLRPLARFAAGPARDESRPETSNVVSAPAEYDRALRLARDAGKPVVVKFTADWCATCKSNERAIERDPEIQKLLARFSLVTVDVTSMSDEAKDLMSRESVFGPPTLLVVDRSGSERASARTVGPIDISALGKELAYALK